MPDATEHSLLEQARAGDREAFAALQSALEGPARRFVRRLIGTSDVEDDIIQNTFFALYMNLDRLDTGEKLRPFVFRVLRNQCYDELRTRGRFDVISMDDDVESASETEYAIDQRPQPDESAHWLLLYNEVQQAIDRLPETQRETLLLYSVANLSYAEIAEATGASIGTVKSRLHYAKRNLLRLLEPQTLAALDVAGESEENHVDV